MKMLVVGGTSGIGKVIADHYGATAVSKRTGHRLPTYLQTVLKMSLAYDVIVNCVSDDNQNLLLEKLYSLHHEKNFSTHIITFGSMSYKINNSDYPKNKLLKFADSILLEKSKVKHTIINPAWCFNSNDETNLSLIPQEDIINTVDLILNFSNVSVISQIEIKGT